MGTYIQTDSEVITNYQQILQPRLRYLSNIQEQFWADMFSCSKILLEHARHQQYDIIEQKLFSTMILLTEGEVVGVLDKLKQKYQEYKDRQPKYAFNWVHDGQHIVENVTKKLKSYNEDVNSIKLATESNQEEMEIKLPHPFKIDQPNKMLVLDPVNSVQYELIMTTSYTNNILNCCVSVQTLNKDGKVVSIPQDNKCFKTPHEMVNYYREVYKCIASGAYTKGTCSWINKSREDKKTASTGALPIVKKDKADPTKQATLSQNKDGKYEISYIEKDDKGNWIYPVVDLFGGAKPGPFPLKNLEDAQKLFNQIVQKFKLN